MSENETLSAVQDPLRLELLRSLNLLDTPAEEAFDRLTRLASKITDTPISLISLIDADRQFMKSLLGLPEQVASDREIPLSHSVCKHVVARQQALIVEDARDHPLLKDNPAVPDFSVIGYLGMPLTTTTGVTLGSFCVIDTRPRHWTEKEIDIIRELALSTMTEIELRAEVAARREAERQIEEMSSMIVHDLRTPLTIVGGVLEMLQLTQNEPKMREKSLEMLNEAILSTERMNSMIEDLLNLSKSEAGMLESVKVEVPPERFLRTQEAIYRTQAELDGQRVVLRLAPNLPAVQLDRALIGRVIDNLVSNAIKYGPAGGTIEISARCDANMLVIGVHDEGQGIAPNLHEAIFDKFFQARDERGQPTRRGVGIGLAFCKLAVEMHQGRIWVESQPGEGSSFFFSLPVVR